MYKFKIVFSVIGITDTFPHNELKMYQGAQWEEACSVHTEF
jgi:hypothetical protein